MSDWPAGITSFLSERYYISTHSTRSILHAGVVVASPPSSQLWPFANRANFYPFRIAEAIRITHMWVLNGATVSGNLDAGIYSLDGVKLSSTGSVAQAGTNVIQEIALTSAIRIGSGCFYMALVLDNGTGTVWRHGFLALFAQILGIAGMNSAFPLPATATLVSMATLSSGNIPVFGFICEEA
jgi:hypothetical protein